jgi:hypothetical protein
MAKVYGWLGSVYGMRGCSTHIPQAKLLVDLKGDPFAIR